MVRLDPVTKGNGTMNITKRTRLAIGAVGLCTAIGLAAGGAFTGTGLETTGQAAAPQFVGGTISQVVTGAVLNNVLYGFTDITNTHVNLITLTFGGETVDGLHVAVALSGGTGGTFTCEDIGATTTKVAVCTPDAAPYLDLHSLAVTVS